MHSKYDIVQWIAEHKVLWGGISWGSCGRTRKVAAVLSYQCLAIYLQFCTAWGVVSRRTGRAWVCRFCVLRSLCCTVSSRLGREASLLSEFPDVSKGIWWALKMKAPRTVKTLGTTKPTTKLYIPERPKSLTTLETLGFAWTSFLCVVCTRRFNCGENSCCGRVS